MTPGGQGLIRGRRFSILSPLSPGEAQTRLANATGPARTGLFERSAMPLTGRVTGGTFTVTRTSHGRNSFRPVIRGAIEPAAGGSRIHGTMRLHEVVLGFLGFLILALTWFLLSGGLPPGALDRSVLLLPAIMVGLVMMAWLGFTWESRRALATLAEIVDGAGND